MIKWMVSILRQWCLASSLLFLCGTCTVAKDLPDAAMPGATDYAKYCSPCHGAIGNGQGPMATLIQPKPRNHRDADYMNGLSDDYLFNLIRDGGPSLGKSKMMAPWGEILSDSQIFNLIRYIRWLSQ